MNQPNNTTQIGAVVANKVALATVVWVMARCQKNKSAEKAAPAQRVARGKRLEGFPHPRSLIRIQPYNTGKASATRQKALVKGPTPARRTKIGESPMATAPMTSAANGAARLWGRTQVATELFISNTTWTLPAEFMTKWS
jgi:cell pole-organizing protein PopZ